MKSFDPASQRSIDELDYVNIYPAREKVLGGEQSFFKIFLIIIIPLYILMSLQEPWTKQEKRKMNIIKVQPEE